MRLNLKLTHQALILVIVPLLFEIVFVAVLYGLLKQAQNDRQRTAHAQIVIAHVHKLLELLVDSTTDTAGLVLGQNRTKDSARSMQLVQLFAEFDRVNELLQGEPDKQRLLALTREYFKSEVVEVEEIRTLSDAGHQEDALMRLNLLQTKIRQSNKLLKQLIEGEESIYSERDAVQARSWSLLDQILLAGIALNILQAISLALYFNRGTIRRLDMLMDNAQRLGRAEPLNPPLEVSDEIGQLDQVFHDVDLALRQAEQRKQELVAMVTHDLRAPLTSLQFVFTLLASGVYGELSEKAQTGVEVAERNTERLITLINDLLDIEKIKAGKLELNLANVQMLPLIQQSIEAVHHFAEAQNVAIVAPIDDVQVVADGDRIVQVLINLLSNAIKFSAAGSSVVISIFQTPAFAEVRVTDKGTGIPDRYKEVIFDQFQQVDEKAERTPERMKGTGLGLAISTEIIKQHKGMIGVESKEGEGSTFWFRLKRSIRDEQ